MSKSQENIGLMFSWQHECGCGPLDKVCITMDMVPSWRILFAIFCILHAKEYQVFNLVQITFKFCEIASAHILQIAKIPVWYAVEPVCRVWPRSRVCSTKITGVQVCRLSQLVLNVMCAKLVGKYISNIFPWHYSK